MPVSFVSPSALLTAIVSKPIALSYYAIEILGQE